MSRAVFALVCSASLMGCIITREPSYSEPPNTPPVIVERTPSFHQVVDVVRNVGSPDTDGGVNTQVTFSATIFDPDVDQPLTGVVMRNYIPGDEVNRPLLNPIAIDPTGDGASLRTMSFPLDRATIAPRTGCFTIELHVSSEFRDVVLNPVPADRGDIDHPADLARTVWWLRVVDDPEDSVLLEDCERAAP